MQCFQQDLAPARAPAGTLLRIAGFLQFPLEEKGPWGLFHQLRWALAKGRHLLQILLKALWCMYIPSKAVHNDTNCIQSSINWILITQSRLSFLVQVPQG